MTNLKLNSNIVLKSTDENIIRRCIKDNTFDNPVFKSNELCGRSNWDTEETISTYRYENENLILPRGYMRDLMRIFKEYNITPTIIDERFSQSCIYPKELIGITLRPYQIRSVEEALKYDQGVVCAPTGSGKSILGLEIIKQHSQKSLIIVNRSDLAKQWMDVIKECLEIKAGYIGEGQWEIGNEITIAMIQTLSTKVNETKALSDAFGLVLVDETHHLPASSFFDVLGILNAKYRYGLSATLARRDGLEPIIYLSLGHTIATISKQEVEGIGATVPAKVISIETGFNPGFVDSFQEYISSIVTNTNRNKLIIDLANQSEGSVLILCDRVEHTEQISEMLTEMNLEHVLVHGQLKNREDAMEKMKTSAITVGTTGLLGEGLDVSCWAILIMASPISSEIKLLQGIGRVVRPSPGKEIALVYDLRDDCAFSGSSFKKRFEIYKKHKIWVDFNKKKAA